MSKFKSALLILLISFIGVSCIDTSDPEPENPAGQLTELLAGTQYHMATLMGSDFARYQLMWMQQLSGIRGSHLLVERYNPQASSFDTFWENYYIELMQRLRVIEYISIEYDAPVYRGISLVLQAYLAGLMSDVWGDMPFDEANKYYANQPSPAYDSQESIYDTMLEYLHDGISFLQDPNPGELVPGAADDFFYEGSVQKWLQAARMIRLRYSLRLAHKNQDYSVPLQWVQQGGMFEGVQSDMSFPYSAIPGVNNPWYVFDFNIGNTRMGKRFVDLLHATDDPRLTRFVRMNTGNEYVGVVPGTGTTPENSAASRIGNTTNAIGTASSRLYLLTYSEQQFIESEVYHRMGMQTQSDAAYNLGVLASLEMHHAHDEDWEAQHANKEGVVLESIITAKYIALFLNPEVWTDWRRTGYPVISPPINNENDYHVPRRFLYPTIETLNNPSNVPVEVTLNTRVWWDDL